MNSQWYSKKWVTVSLHILFWTVFFIMPYLLQPVFDEDTVGEFQHVILVRTQAREKVDAVTVPLPEIIGNAQCGIIPVGKNSSIKEF